MLKIIQKELCTSMFILIMLKYIHILGVLQDTSGLYDDKFN